MSMSFIPYYIDDLATLITNLKTKLKVIGMSKCRIRKSTFPFSNINIDKYTTIAPSKGGTLLSLDK